MRIGKYIANAGICSRRKAEELIKNKEVKINNCICINPATKINEKDIIKVSNKIIKINKKIRIWKLYKPIKYIVSNKDEKNRKTVFDLIPKNFPRLISIGRLDYMSEGLLLFTNNGDFARKLELPKSNYLRVYRVCIKNQINKNHINKINKGIIINKIEYKKINISIEKSTKEFIWLIVKLKEGKNREIRKIFEYFSWGIIKLVRIQFGPYKLLKLKEGKIIEINKI
tara:strand:+ start:2502 stop:3182 length:681 start_codon:yes stop_codon:yes gene_type:complete